MWDSFVRSRSRSVYFVPTPWALGTTIAVSADLMERRARFACVSPLKGKSCADSCCSLGEVRISLVFEASRRAIAAGVAGGSRFSCSQNRGCRTVVRCFSGYCSLCGLRSPSRFGGRVGDEAISALCELTQGRRTRVRLFLFAM